MNPSLGKQLNILGIVKFLRGRETFIAADCF